MIEIQKLSYNYHDGTSALHDVSLKIKDEEKICLAGPNGAGKTTLLHCLAGLLETDQNLPASIGLVFQNPDDQLFCPSIGEDISFGPRNQKKSEKEVAHITQYALNAVGLDGFEQRHAHHLSGGEKKRAAIAAVLACQPSILAFDEPWANLDARASQAITDIMKQFFGTLIVSTHDLRHAAKVCDRMLIIDHGKLVADLDMQPALNDKGLLTKYGLEI